MAELTTTIKVDTKQANADIKKFSQQQQTKINLSLNVARLRQQISDARKQLKNLSWAAQIQLRAKIERMQWDLRKASAELRNFTDRWDKNLSWLQKRFQDLWRDIKWSFKQLASWVAIFGALISAWRWLIRFFGAAIESASKFEKQMSNVATLIDTNVESMKDMKKELLDIATRVPVSIEDLTTALYDVRSAWIQAKDAMSVLEQSAILAESWLWTTQEAVNLLTSAFNTFSIQGYNAEEMAQTLFLAVKNGKTTISELTQWFGSVASIAQNLNVDFKDLVASATALTTSWLSASEAYTQINAVLSAVAKQTPQSVKMAKELWFEFSSTALSTKWLKWFIEDLWVSLKENNITGVKSTEVLSKLFGRKEALSGVLSLLNSRSEAYNDTLEEMQKGSNALTIAFEKQNSTAEAWIQRINNQIEEQKILLWENLIPTQILWRETILVITKSLNWLSDALSWASEKLWLFWWRMRNQLQQIEQLKNSFDSFNKVVGSGTTAGIDMSNLVQPIERLQDITKWGILAWVWVWQEIKKDMEYIEEETKNIWGSFSNINKVVEKQKDNIKDLKEEMQRYAKETEDMIAKRVVKSFEKSWEAIEENIDNLQKLTDWITSLEEDIQDIDKSLANRVVEIETQLQDWDLSLEDRKKLEEELAQAKAETTKEAIEEARKREEANETERLLMKKEKAEEEINILENKLDKETELLKQNIAEQIKLQQEYTNFELKNINTIIRKTKELAQTKANAWMPSILGWASTVNNTTLNQTNNITNSTAAVSVIRKTNSLFNW